MRNSLLLLGAVIGIVFGIVGLIPTLAVKNYLAAAIFTILVVLGLVLLSFAFED